MERAWIRGRIESSGIGMPLEVDEVEEVKQCRARPGWGGHEWKECTLLRTRE
jgi:hypothetical protein